MSKNNFLFFANDYGILVRLMVLRKIYCVFNIIFILVFFVTIWYSILINFYVFRKCFFILFVYFRLYFRLYRFRCFLGNSFYKCNNILFYRVFSKSETCSRTYLYVLSEQKSWYYLLYFLFCMVLDLPCPRHFCLRFGIGGSS